MLACARIAPSRSKQRVASEIPLSHRPLAPLHPLQAGIV